MTLEQFTKLDCANKMEALRRMFLGEIKPITKQDEILSQFNEFFGGLNR